MNPIDFRQSTLGQADPLPARARILRRLATLCTVCLALVGCAADELFRSPPAAEKNSSQGEIGEARFVARAFPDDESTRQTFGFSPEDAGLLPIALAIENHGRSLFRISPERSVVMDRNGNPWPLLNSEQVMVRATEAVTPWVKLQNGLRDGALGSVAGAATRLGITLVRKGSLTAINAIPATPMLIGAAAGAFEGLTEESTESEDRLRMALIGHSLRGKRIAGGEFVQGFLFFARDGEADAVKSVRLGLEVDGYPRILDLDLSRAPPAKTPADQPRREARAPMSERK